MQEWAAMMIAMCHVGIGESRAAVVVLGLREHACTYGK